MTRQRSLFEKDLLISALQVAVKVQTMRRKEAEKQVRKYQGLYRGWKGTYIKEKIKNENGNQERH